MSYAERYLRSALRSKGCPQVERIAVRSRRRGIIILRLVHARGDADDGKQQLLPPSEHKDGISPPPIGDEGIFTDAPNPEAGHEKEVSLRPTRQVKSPVKAGLLNRCSEDHQRTARTTAKPAKVLSSSEDAHIESMSTFATDEHLHPFAPRTAISSSRSTTLSVASSTGSTNGLNVVVNVYRMLGCSGLFPALYQGDCKHQVIENAAYSADLG
jgi:hypothetical protein